MSARQATAKVRRVVLKLSGEALGPETGLGVDMARVAEIARQIKKAAHSRRGTAEIAVVIGGGNLVRGRRLVKSGINATVADYMGMLSTVMNGLALQDSLEKLGQETSLQSAIEMPGIALPFSPKSCVENLRKGRIVILVGGTGNPHFTTDTAAALRAREIAADRLLKGTNVDGVYSADPAVNKKAKLYRRVSYTECLTKGLQVMDATAIALCREVALPVVVFNYKVPGNIERAIWGEELGTLVGGS